MIPTRIDAKFCSFFAFFITPVKNFSVKLSIFQRSIVHEHLSDLHLRRPTPLNNPKRNQSSFVQSGNLNENLLIKSNAFDQRILPGKCCSKSSWCCTYPLTPIHQFSVLKTSYIRIAVFSTPQSQVPRKLLAIETVFATEVVSQMNRTREVEICIIARHNFFEKISHFIIKQQKPTYDCRPQLWFWFNSLNFLQ